MTDMIDVILSPRPVVQNEHLFSSFQLLQYLCPVYLLQTLGCFAIVRAELILYSGISMLYLDHTVHNC